MRRMRPDITILKEVVTPSCGLLERACQPDFLACIIPRIIKDFLYSRVCVSGFLGFRLCRGLRGLGRHRLWLRLGWRLRSLCDLASVGDAQRGHDDNRYENQDSGKQA